MNTNNLEEEDKMRGKRIKERKKIEKKMCRTRTCI